MEKQAFIQLAVSLLLGLLVGLQRERTDATVAGIRTFPLITAFGTLCGWMAQSLGGWVIAAGLLAVAAMLVMANLARIKGGDIDPGITTEIAVLTLFGIGACLVVSHMALAIAAGGVVALLLHWKDPMHKFVSAIGDTDLRAIMQFALVALVILPILPNRAYGPYEVLNPFKIWLFVVLIVGMSLSGYLIFKFMGERVGTWLGGILGGLISSTATTASYSRRAKENASSAELAALVIMIASASVYVRVLVLMGVAAPEKFLAMAMPIALMFVTCSVVALVYSGRTRKKSGPAPEQRNPAQLKSALIFGALYAIVSLGISAAREHFGSSGLYVAAIISGMTDMDAVTLSTAQLSGRDQIAAATAWRLILAASLSNFLFKAAIAAWLGGRELLKIISILFAIAIAVGGALLLFWPN